MHKIINFLVFLFTITSAFSQELNELEIKKIREIQEHLISNPKKAYLEALEISQSNHGIFSLHGQYYVACYYYNQSNFIHSKKLIIKLLDSIEKEKKIISDKNN